MTCGKVGLPTLILALGGCGDLGNQLYIANTTKLGLNASLNTTRQAGSVGLGYDRYFVTWVPRSVQLEGIGPAGPGAANQPRDVMSVLACSNLVVSGLTIKEFDESLATGDAARNFAEHLKDKPSAIPDDYFKCFNDQSSSPKPATTEAAAPGGQS